MASRSLEETPNTAQEGSTRASGEPEEAKTISFPLSVGVWILTFWASVNPRRPRQPPRSPQEDPRQSEHSPETSKTASKNTEEGQDVPKRATNLPKRASGRIQRGRGGPLDCPNTAPRYPVDGEKSPKTAQENPKTAQEASKRPKRAPRGPQDCSIGAPHSPQTAHMNSMRVPQKMETKGVSCDSLALRPPHPLIHLRDVQDVVGQLQQVPAPTPSASSASSSCSWSSSPSSVTNNVVINIIIITILRTPATRGAGLARWRDLPQAAG